jgi:hypothetical protein
MTANTIDLEFGDGQYTFALPLAQIAELQRKTGIGIGGLYARTIKGVQVAGGKVVLIPGAAEFYALDLIETIRHGLIGGGKGVVNGEEIEVTPIIANRLVDAYVLGRPLKFAWDVAATVLGTCIVGCDPPKKDEPARERAPRKGKRKTAA